VYLQPLLLSMQCACDALKCPLWSIRIYHFFTHFLTHGTIFEEEVIGHKVVFCFFLQILFETLLLLRRTERDIYHKHTEVLMQSFMKLEFLERFPKNNQISNFIKFPPVVPELLHADGRTDTMQLTVAFRNFAKAPNSSSDKFPLTYLLR
jgi:hypothetical protein